MRNFIIAISFLILNEPSRAVEPDSIWNEGVSNFRKENYHGAISNMNEYLEIKPGNSSAVYNRGLARIKLGDIDKACLDFLTAKNAGFRRKARFVNFYCNPSYIVKLLKKHFYKNEELLYEKGYRPEYTRADSLRGALRQERNCYNVYYYDLTVRIIPHGKRITGCNNIYFTVLESTKSVQIDLFENYTIKRIKWNDRELNFNREFNAVFVNFPELLNPQERHIISVEYSGKPGVAKNPPWDGGFVWKRDKRFNRWAGVACEHLGASSWWPNKD
ncbi:MAG: hypothetical protein JSV22_11010, partial [Bacteroidales bacterium]